MSEKRSKGKVIPWELENIASNDDSFKISHKSSVTSSIRKQLSNSKWLPDESQVLKRSVSVREQFVSSTVDDLRRAYFPMGEDGPNGRKRSRRSSSGAQVEIELIISRLQNELKRRGKLRRLVEQFTVYTLRGVLAFFNVVRTPWFRSVIAFASVCSTLGSSIVFTITFSLRSGSIPLLLVIIRNLFDAFFCFEYLLNVLLVPNMLAYITSSLGVVDFLCSFVALTVDIFPDLPTYVGAFIRTLRIFKLARLQIFMPTEVKKQLFNMTLQMIGIAFVFTGLIASAENLDFLTGMYFVTTTITTVGYGDVPLQSDVSRVLTVSIILLTWIMVPMQTQRLVAIMGTKSAHARRRFFISPNTKHIIVCGNLNNGIGAFCKEFFHPDHKLHSGSSGNVQVVILSRGPPTAEVRLLLSDPRFVFGLTYLDGDPMDPKDLARACAEDAAGVFILSDKHGRDAAREDYSTIMVGLSVVKHINAQKRNCCKTNLMLELLDPRHRRVFQSVAKVVVPRTQREQKARLGFRRKSIGLKSRTKRSLADEARRDTVLPVKKVSKRSVELDSEEHSDSMDSNATYESDELPTPLELGVEIKENTEGKIPLTTWKSCEFICVNELKMHLLALTCLSPGISTLVGNLIHSLDTQDTSELEWKSEYNSGTEFEIYTESVCSSFSGVPFLVAADIVHEATGMLMFALEIKDSDMQQPHIILNPGNMRIPNPDTVKVRAFVMATDKESAAIISNLIVKMGIPGSTLFGKRTNRVEPFKTANGTRLEEKDAWNISTMKKSAVKLKKSIILAQLEVARMAADELTNRITLPPPNTSQEAIEQNALNVQVGSQGEMQLVSAVSSALTVTKGNGDNDAGASTPKGHSHVVTRVNVTPVGEDSRKSLTSRLKSRKKLTLGFAPVDETSKTGSSRILDTDAGELKEEEKISKEEDTTQPDTKAKAPTRKPEYDKLALTYHIRDSPQLLEKVLVLEGLAMEFPEVRNHIVVCGGIHNKQDFVLPLRSKSLLLTVPLVFLCPTVPKKAEWETISMFPEVYIAIGSANDNKQLQKVGIKYAARAIVFAGPKMENYHSDNVIDADTIFTYRTITAENPRVPIVCEITKEENIGLLEHQTKLKQHKVDFQLWNVYAAGQVYTSSIMDSLVAQSFFNHDMLKIVEMMLVGFTKKHYYRRHLMQKYGMFSSCRLLDFPVPPQFHSKTYGSLFKFLVEKQAIPLALRRGVMSKIRMGPIGNKTPYVYTNPHREALVYECDMVFVLATDALLKTTAFSNPFNPKASKSAMNLRNTLIRTKSVMFNGILQAVDKTKDKKKKTLKRESIIADKSSFLTGYSSPKNIQRRETLLKARASQASLRSIQTTASLRSLQGVVSRTSRRMSATMNSLNAVVHNLEATVHETDLDDDTVTEQTSSGEDDEDYLGSDYSN